MQLHDPGTTILRYVVCHNSIEFINIGRLMSRKHSKNELKFKKKFFCCHNPTGRKVTDRP